MRIIQTRLYLTALIAVALILAGCGATPIETVEPVLLGSWQGDCEIRVPVVFNPNELPDTVERVKQTVTLEITIHEDATVDGTVGSAVLSDSVLRHNRSELGRMLKMASDYIVIDGQLNGPIVTGSDDTEVKSFTIPFDLEDGQVQGGLMWLQTGKYPFPLCSVSLERAP